MIKKWSRNDREMAEKWSKNDQEVTEIAQYDEIQEKFKKFRKPQEQQKKCLLGPLSRQTVGRGQK